DDNGHGTHVAGIIAGNGSDSNGQKAGSAPDASIVSLKVLDAQGNGTIGNIITALDWVVANKTAYNIRAINLSVGASIKESYWTDPLTLAAKRVVDAGVVVVTAAGNIGKNAAGLEQYGGITAPGNAPWVLTVGASSSMGTTQRDDDTIAGYSSRGPTFVDWGAKPDLVAPGSGVVSLSDPASTFYATKTAFLVAGQASTPFVPYLSLSGTSMAGRGCGNDGCDNIVWGSFDADNIVWGSLARDNIVWGNSRLNDNIVWGSDCGGADCDVAWGSSDLLDNIVWGSCDKIDNIVW